MPCGKFKGKDIEEIPNSYLIWVAENWKEKTPRDVEVIKAADKEVQFRQRHDINIEG